MPDPSPTAEAPSPGARRLAAIAGGLLCVSFFALSQTPQGLQYDFHGPWNLIPAAELQFWLGHFMLFLPGMLLVGWSIWPDRWPTIRDGASRVASWTEGQLLRRLGIAGAAWFGLAVAGRHLILRGYPITDDENSVRFGGRLLAQGRAWVEPPPLIDALPNAYLYLWNDRLASFDWLGSQIAWAAAELTGFAWPWPLLSAAALVSCGWVAHKKVGAGYGALAAFFLALSPMFVTLSMTTHAHVLSRGFVACFLAAWLVARERGTFGSWFVAGLCVGAATLCRPYESAALLSPFAVWTAWAFLRRESWARPAILGMGVALVFPLVAWLLHQHAITGSWGVTTRSAASPNEIPWRIISIPASATLTDPERLWARLGGNLAYNVWMLMIFFGGPIGAALVALGIRASGFARLLAAGVAVHLLLALFHDDSGIHIVGPIHYSEAAIFLAILACYGTRELLATLDRWRLPRGPLLTPIVVAFTMGSLFFSMWMVFGLRRQADVQAAIWAVVEEAELPDESVLLGPDFHLVFKHHPEWNRTASWVLSWPPARPPAPPSTRWGAGDDILFVNEELADRADVRTAYPDRGIYRMRLLDQTPWVTIEPAEQP